MGFAVSASGHVPANRPTIQQRFDAALWNGTAPATQRKALQVLGFETYSDAVKRRNGAQGRNRTSDTAIFSRMLYQLSYLGVRAAMPSGAEVDIVSSSARVHSPAEMGAVSRKGLWMT